MGLRVYGLIGLGFGGLGFGAEGLGFKTYNYICPYKPYTLGYIQRFATQVMILIPSWPLNYYKTTCMGTLDYK